MSFPDLIALGGYAGAGKDTVANILVEKADYKRVAFADALRQVLEEMNPLIPTPYGAVNLNYVLGDVGWDVAKREYPEVRRLMQNLGQAVRVHAGIDTWVTAAVRKTVGHHRVVVTDVRYRNELLALKKVDALTAWVFRPSVAPLNAHPSENDLTAHDFDYLIRNHSTKDDLAADVLLHFGGAR